MGGSHDGSHRKRKTEVPAFTRFAGSSRRLLLVPLLPLAFLTASHGGQADCSVSPYFQAMVHLHTAQCTQPSVCTRCTSAAPCAHLRYKYLQLSEAVKGGRGRLDCHGCHLPSAHGISCRAGSDGSGDGGAACCCRGLSLPSVGGCGWCGVFAGPAFPLWPPSAPQKAARSQSSRQQRRGKADVPAEQRSISG